LSVEIRRRAKIGAKSPIVYNTIDCAPAPRTTDHRPLFLTMFVDRFARTHNNLRISVTDRCNIRCFYCMPAEDVQFKPREELLSYEEIERFVRVVVGLGVNKIRLTGGEPLVRQQVPELVRRLAAIPGIHDLAL